MKKLLLLSALLIFACSSGGDGSDNSSDFPCNDFTSSTSPSSARQQAIDYDVEYNDNVELYGDPVDDGYFLMDDVYVYIFMFNDTNDNNNKYCYTVGNCGLVTESVGCTTTDFIEDCYECLPFGTRIN